MSQETITSGRSRRARKKIDYSQEQTFSDVDEDVFQDEPLPEKKKKSSRKSNASSGGGGGAVLDNGMFERTKPVYSERNYDPTELPIREKFTFEPEFEEDGSPAIEIIIGRRPIDDAKDRHVAGEGGTPGSPNSDEDSDDDSDAPRRTRSIKKMKSKSMDEDDEENNSEMDYEYLVKYKGRSYLHLEWKTAADLESMNVKAKSAYRRFLKKLEAGTDEELEDPTVDPAYTEPGRILAEEDHEMMVELSDKELAKWEKEQKKEMEELESDDDDNTGEEKKEEMDVDDKPKDGETKEAEEPAVEITEPGTMALEDLRKVVNKDGPYYPVFPGSTNAYADGYITEPPRKPRASYLFFQGIYRGYFGKKFPNSSLSQNMGMVGDAWRALSEEQQAPFILLAKEEAQAFEREKELLELAQKPSAMWQPIRRCKAVLDRLCDDPMSSIFLEPVDTDVFTDYLDIVEFPMDLRTVRERLNNTKNWMGPEGFARDVRKVWNNCKIYNQHGSQIWHVADCMAKLFERLYHAWILDFRDRYIRWAKPEARPWELTCRISDGACKTPDTSMVLCDHCDAMYSINCLKPKLKKVPKGVWHCPMCLPKVGKNRTVTLLSAATEQAARKRAEMGDIPKKPVKQKMFLVKWAGLGYEHCTWETQADINDDAIIAEFRRLEGVTPEEPDMTEKEVQDVIQSAVAPKKGSTGNNTEMDAMKLQLNAQQRAFQFKKFGMDTPHLVAAEVGPKEQLFAGSKSASNDEQHPTEVATVLEEVVWKVATNDADFSNSYHHSLLPPPLYGEYDAKIPVTTMGLLLNVGEVDKNVAFLGYRQFPDGTKGPAEVKNLCKRNGDIIIAVNGKSLVGKPFKEVIPYLKESIRFAYIRFVHKDCTTDGGSMTSCGNLGRYMFEDLSKTFKEDRRRLLAKRSLALLEEEEDADDSSTSSEEASDDSVDSDDSDSDATGIEPDSEDEALLRERESTDSDSQGDAAGTATNNAVDGNAKGSTETAKKDISDLLLGANVSRQASTQHLALSLLGMDVGYSSDEGGDEDVAHYIDGVDGTFTQDVVEAPPKPSEAEASDVTTLAKLPVKKTDFSIIGNTSQLQVAVALTGKAPDITDFDNYPLPSAKQIEAERLKAEEEARKAEEEAKQAEEDARKKAEEAAKPKKKSTTKIEQVSTMSNDVVRIWANAEDASATLQLDYEKLQRLLNGKYDAELGDEVGGFRWRYADQDAVVTSIKKDSKKAREAYLQFKDKLYDPAKPHTYKNENKLRDYQVDGVNWLAASYYNEQGCILADEMGLGKTCQIVTYLEHLFRVEKLKGPFLVVVPLSTVEHWRREFEAWTDMQCCVYHDRQRVWRDVLREYEWYYEDRPHTPDYLKFNVLVTTYDTLIGDFDVIGDVPWRVAVVDEAHRLRNVKGKLLECMKEISAKGTLKFGHQSRVLMTGTPLQNNTQELWTLLNFIEPSLFRSLEEFEESFGDMKNRHQVEALQQKISPFMLRRVKEDVAKDIPAKEETVIDVELTSIQKQYYRAIFEHNHAFLSMGSAKTAAPKLMNIQMELRKCCNHPFLLDGIESREMENRHEQLTRDGTFDGKTPDEQHEILNKYGYVMSSGKMVLLDKLLPKLKSEGHKVLIFSQFVKMLDLISDYCEFRDFRYERLDGRVRGNERQKAIDRFETEDDSFMFLLSTRAGGVGINLTAADICIIFDSDWNPQNDVQAQARCHRIGQTKDVMIYRLVTSRTFEQEMFDRASKKLGLEQAVLGTFDQDNGEDKPTSKEMEQLLKKGAYALLEDENDEIGKEFVADDIESILEKRTRTRVVEGAKTASWLNKKGMNVTKSKFSTDSAGIDVDDPLFWQKVMPDFVTPEILLNKISEMEEWAEKPKPGRKTKKSEGLSKANKKKVAEFMSDLKGVMEDIFDQEREGALSSEEKTTCQTLLLTISVKEKIFTEQQRQTAKKLLQKLDGDRRRKCRTSNIGGAGDDDIAAAPASIRKELLITKSKKRKSKGRKSKGGDDSDSDDDKPRKKRSRGGGDEIDEDGYKKWSDDEGDWSDVDDDIYKNGKKSISMKQVKTRREWGAGKEPMKLAAMPWPVFPRHSVAKVLGSLIDEAIRIDTEKLGIFSVPVPKESFPDYYELIKNPMDYGTMKEKLERGEYRSAQAMQKDFILVNTNCLKFNAPDSDIVREAQRQTLMRPKLLKEAAVKNSMFICEDGTVVNVHDDPKAKSPKKPQGKLVACGECEGCKTKACKKCEKCTSKPKRRCILRKCTNMTRVTEDTKKKPGRPKKKSKKGDEDGSGYDDDKDESKPRIKIKMPQEKKQASKKRKAGTPSKEENGNTKKKARRSPGEEDVDEMFDVDTLQAEHDSLQTWQASRNSVTKLGPWRLPSEIESEFKEVGKLTLINLSKVDEYDIFADPVDASEVPDYYETITNPMDFSTMKSKVMKGEYGEGSAAAAKLYEDFLLVFDNCYQFNNGEGEVVEEAMSVLKAMSLTFAKVCNEVKRMK